MSDFNDKSTDAMFASILSEIKELRGILHHQDGIMYRIEEQTTKHNGRMSRIEFAIEIFKWVLGGVFPVVAGAWALYTYLHPHK